MNTYAKLERILLSGEITEDDNKLLNSYPEISEDDLGPQLHMFRRTRQVSSLKDVVSELQNMLPEVRGEYPDVCNLTKLLLVSPASSAEAERTFSALRRLKTWLRTTMTETRLNSVTVCHINRHRLDKLDLKPLLRDFVLHSWKYDRRCLDSLCDIASARQLHYQLTSHNLSYLTMFKCCHS